MVNDIGGSTIAAFDTSGVVFAVACSDIQAVMLYDSTTLDAVRAHPCSLLTFYRSRLRLPRLLTLPS